MSRSSGGSTPVSYPGKLRQTVMASRDANSAPEQMSRMIKAIQTQPMRRDERGAGESHIEGVAVLAGIVTDQVLDVPDREVEAPSGRQVAEPDQAERDMA